MINSSCTKDEWLFGGCWMSGGTVSVSELGWKHFIFFFRQISVISWPMNHGRFVMECKQMRWNSTRKKNFHSHPTKCVHSSQCHVSAHDREWTSTREKKVNLNFMTVKKIKAHAEEKSYYRCAHKPAWKLEFFHRKLKKPTEKKTETRPEICWEVNDRRRVNMRDNLTLFFAWLFNLCPDQISTIPTVRLGLSSTWTKNVFCVATRHHSTSRSRLRHLRCLQKGMTENHEKRREVLNIHSHAWDNIENISRKYEGIFLSQCGSKPTNVYPKAMPMSERHNREKKRSERSSK